MMAYVPPHLRQQQDGGPSCAKRDSVRKSGPYTLHEINKYFSPDAEPSSIETSTTLHGSTTTPDRLVFVLLFSGANPRWEVDGIIFTKSNLNLLPAESDLKEVGGTDTSVPSDQNGTVPVDSQANPIAVFKQASHVRAKHAGVFSFDGWYRVDKVAFLEPTTPELIRMLEQKWTVTMSNGRTVKKAREAKGWNESLRHRWAVVKLSRDEEACKQRGEPDIEVIMDGDTGAKKSVNEMLAEMRLGSSAKIAASSAEDDKAAEVVESSAKVQSQGLVGD